MRKWKLIMVLAGLAVVIALGAFVFWPRADRITAANQIKAGMSATEVEAVLGPAGDYTSFAGQPAVAGVQYLLDARAGFYKPIDSEPHWLSSSTRWWHCDDGCIGVCFDRIDTVEAVVLRPFVRTPQGPLENLLWRAKRQWHRWFP